MATSEKQIKANRKNGLKGGVKTSKGKEKSKYNALKHGLLARHVVVETTEKREYLKFCSNIHEELDPKSTMENFLVERIITIMWRLRKCVQVERHVMECEKYDFSNLSMTTVTYGDEAVQEKKEKSELLDSYVIDRILRYEVTMDKNLYKALAKLEEVQARRRRLEK